MANVSIILGPSGTGKSTSIKTLDPKSTIVFNTLKKRLPFKGSAGMYNPEAKNLYELNNYKDVKALLLFSQNTDYNVEDSSVNENILENYKVNY